MGGDYKYDYKTMITDNATKMKLKDLQGKYLFEVGRSVHGRAGKINEIRKSVLTLESISWKKDPGSFSIPVSELNNYRVYIDYIKNA